jgi:hypothetical protein
MEQYMIDLTKACYDAAMAMGDDLKGMSCFISNWSVIK